MSKERATENDRYRAYDCVCVSSAHAANIWSRPRINGMGGTNIFINGVINYGDEKIFATYAKQAPLRVFVYPAGPGGNVFAALTIGDMIADLGYTTVVENGYNCASACALIWASGYANHAIARNSAFIRFHSCANYEAGDRQGQDDMECNYIIMKYLKSYGFTDLQASGVRPRAGQFYAAVLTVCRA